MTKITEIAQKEILSVPLFSVSENTLQLPNGKQIKHYDVHRRPTVDVFPLTEQGEIYLIKQYRHMYKKTILEAIAGHIDIGETAQQAAIRELQEEAGISAKTIQEIGNVYLSGSVLHSHSSVFVAKDLTIGEAHPDESEEIEVIKMSLGEAVEKVLSGEVVTAVSAYGILVMEQLRRKGIL